MRNELEVIFPVYNEEERLLKYNVLESYHTYLLDHFGDRFSILVVINASNDRTLEIVDSLTKKYQHISYINIQTKGKGAAFLEGFRHVTAPVFVFVDIDGAVRPTEIGKLFSQIQTNDIVIGSRGCRGSNIVVYPPLRRRINSFLAGLCIRLLLKLPVRDFFCGFKMFKTSCLYKILPMLKSYGNMIDVNILYAAHKKGIKFKETPIEWRYIPSSKFSIIKSDTHSLRELFKIKYEYCRDYT
ncbi:MAG: glycosyltransferase [Candidatus Omnitrophica bacterium]|nr:glycosyltransferase [Candidatus Omnitrophota bacterium]